MLAERLQEQATRVRLARYLRPSYNRPCDDPVHERRACGSDDLAWRRPEHSTDTDHRSNTICRSSTARAVQRAPPSSKASPPLGFTLEHGKSTVGTVSSRVRALPADTLNITRSALTMARRQAYATVGATDAVVATVTRQREELPARAKRNADKLAEPQGRVNVATDAAARVQQTIASAASELTERSVAAATSVQNITPAATLGRLKTPPTLEAPRRRTPTPSSPFAASRSRPICDTTRSSSASSACRHPGGDGRQRRHLAAQKVRTRASAQAKREAAAASSTPVRTTPTSKVPAHRTTVRNTPPTKLR